MMKIAILCGKMKPTKTLDRIKEEMKAERALRVEVKIPPDEVDRLVVNRLIGIRNANTHKDMSHIDKTLIFFLTEDEFQKHVVGNRKIKF